MTYFAISVFLSAFLLFQIQPLIGKYILPWFGGSSAVWSATMLFFIALLTGGYGYTYWLINRLSARKQGLVHLTLLGFSLVLFLWTGSLWTSPITPGSDWQPQGAGFPIWDICKLLAVAVGLPYLLLATNGPLMQAWFSWRCPGRSPYPLYALSNAGSLLALVSYPFLIEPALTLTAQARLWSAGYVVAIAWAAYGALGTLRGGHAHSMPATRSTVTLPAGLAVPAARGTKVLWVALPACATLLLLATTAKVTQEVAAIPFLWVLPLVLYLASYIVSFTGDRFYVRGIFGAALVVATAAYVWVDHQGFNVPFVHQIVVYSALLFAGCMVCHGELARLKPHPRSLTAYYLLISIGGALGGIAVNLVAPFLFAGFWELPLGVIACWALLAAAVLIGRPRLVTGLIPTHISLAIVAVLAAYACVWFVDARVTADNALLTRRNFYGVLQVSERNRHDPTLHAYWLYHGVTLHGIQYASTDQRHLPTTYYTEASGVGLALLNHPARPGALRVGVLGLGVGTLAAYCQPDDTWRFYEINPDVVRIAEGEGDYFHYLADCTRRVEVVQGDARIALEQELARGERQHFDVLVLDTFNSDSIPVHLLTREALALYLEHLAPDGVLALHISNRYLDLRPVVWGLADQFDLSTALINTSGDGERRQSSVWMLATREGDVLTRPAIAERTTPRPYPSPVVHLWTDDYSNLFQILQ